MSGGGGAGGGGMNSRPDFGSFRKQPNGKGSLSQLIVILVGAAACVLLRSIVPLIVAFPLMFFIDPLLAKLGIGGNGKSGSD